MSAIAKTIWLIEARPLEPLTLDDMASHAGLSRSHLSRIFQIATGYSISAYMRGRRLTEAARALANGAPDILAVALEAGYGSHEAFTRAFREQFGVTPEELRRRRALSNLELVEAIPMDAALKVTIDDPRIDDRGPMLIAGFTEHHLTAGAATIPNQWQRFQPFIGNVTGAVPGAAYGVVADAVEGREGFDYTCGMEVSPGAELPPEFKLLRIPASRYARFPHKGHISTLRSTCQAIYEDWQPRSGLQPTDGISFMEYYGPDFNPVTGLGTVEIWVPLRA